MNRYMENHVAKELEAMLKKAQPLFTTKSCCIYKVPHEIRQSNEDAYTPGLVSIGPLHYGNYRLVTMESHKQVYCQHFIQRSEASLSDLVSCVQQLEPHIRACYSEKINLTVDKLVKVIFIDCCFVIELFLRDEWMRNDAIFSKPWMWVRVEKQGVLTLETSRIAHFTDLLRYLYLTPFHTTTPRERGQLVLGHGASELFKAGVKFQVNKSNHDCILDLEFEHGVLKIPHILVHDKTEVRLRNIVALEQCHYPRHHYLTDYVNFLAQLVNSNKDVDVLINAGIIESTIIGNDTSVNKIFSDVGKNILMENYNANYLQICHGLNAYYKHPWHTKMATLRRDYFTTPWKTVTFIAGIALLLLILLIQTVCSILQV
ncbi:UPF0481 protein At3g47200 isoform X2 [Arachis duranensis]|uniref:UPF0481 protein At3g47200 isoform X2 n=1 Tax=Arachis duranensis TaxID=130453 RepID=A0A9C6WJB8_ARADU|nr:UPF0481 protein At3g47200 isoform X2 [Arachis duranensis]